MNIHHKIGALLAIAAAALLASAAAAADDTSKPSRVPLPHVTIERGTQCVQPTEVMRRNHMQFILHQRDLTMHEGIRTTQFSLKNCVNCHASKTTGSVLGKDGFCQSCHTYAAVGIDCFSCHSDKREPDADQKAEVETNDAAHIAENIKHAAEGNKP